MRLTLLSCLAAAQWSIAASLPDKLEQQVAQAARQYILQQAARDGFVNPMVEVSVVNIARAAAPCRQAVVAPLDTQHPSRMRFAASCADKDEWRQEFVVRAELSAEVVVASAAVPAGRTITDNELALERRSISAVPDALSDPRSVTGLSSRRPLRAGQVVQKRMLVAPTLVKRGETVQIVARNGVVDVSAIGEALETGQRDEIVRVRNTSTGKIIRARITDKAVVEPATMFMQPHSPD